MGIMFRLFLAYDNRFGLMPRLIKSLRASGKPEDMKAAESLQAQLDERKRNPPKNLEEMTQRAMSMSRQVERDLRLEGRHQDADQLGKVIDHTQSRRQRKPENKKE